MVSSPYFMPVEISEILRIVGTSNGGTSNGGTSNGGTSNGDTSNGGTSNGDATQSAIYKFSRISGTLDVNAVMYSLIAENGVELLQYNSGMSFPTGIKVAGDIIASNCFVTYEYANRINAIGVSPFTFTVQDNEIVMNIPDAQIAYYNSTPVGNKEGVHLFYEFTVVEVS